MVGCGCTGCNILVGVGVVVVVVDVTILFSEPNELLPLLAKLALVSLVGY